MAMESKPATSADPCYKPLETKVLAHVPRMMMAAAGLNYEDQIFVAKRREDGTTDKSAWFGTPFDEFNASRNTFANLPYHPSQW